MYIAMVSGLMFVFPLVSVVLEVLVNKNHAALIDVVGKWFVFWAIGIRLFTAGLRQVIKPGLTAEGILGIKDKMSWQLVRELGFTNLGIGLVGIISLWHPAWTSAAALAGGLFLFLAGLEHIRKKQRNFEENVATYSDLFIGLVMAVYLLAQI